MKIVYIGYDILLECLYGLVESNCEVMEIFTCPTDNEFEFNYQICDYAKQHHIPCSMEPVKEKDLRRLYCNGCQAVICAGYFYKVPVIPELPIVNVHPSLLPDGRGAWPMPVQIMKQLPEGGVTLHKMTAEWDAGDILLQQAFPITAQDNLQTVTAKVSSVAKILCNRLAQDFLTLWNNAKPQGKGNYWSCPQKEDYTITQDTEPEDAERILRAFYGFDCYLKSSREEQMIICGRFMAQEHDHFFGDSEQLKNGEKCYYVKGGIIVTPER